MPVGDTPRTFTKMEQADRVRAVFVHACLRYVKREFMTNTTLRARFGIDAKNSVTASRLIKEALGAGVICLQDPNAPPKTRRYAQVAISPTNKKRSSPHA